MSLNEKYEIKIAPERIKKVGVLIDEINAYMWKKDKKDNTEQDAKFNELNSLLENKIDDITYILEYWSWTEVEEFAEQLLMPSPYKDIYKNLVDDELYWLIERIKKESNQNFQQFYSEIIDLNTKSPTGTAFQKIPYSKQNAKEILDSLKTNDDIIYL